MIALATGMGSAIINTADSIHPLESITVIVYVPPDNPEMESFEPKLIVSTPYFHKYTNGSVPTPGDVFTVAVLVPPLQKIFAVITLSMSGPTISFMQMGIA